MWAHYVYQHRRADDGNVFYVGKGSVNRGQCSRAHERLGRSKWWQRVAAKHGYIVEIVAFFRDEKDALDYERTAIAQHGRQNLVNLTDGGEGCVGLIPGKETRGKLSALAQRPRTDAWVKSMRASRKNGGNGGVVKNGDKLPEAWKANIAAAKIGQKNPMFGKQGPRARTVLDVESGATYPSVEAAAKAIGMKMKTLYNRLSGHRPNSTTLRFA